MISYLWEETGETRSRVRSAVAFIQTNGPMNKRGFAFAVVLIINSVCCLQNIPCAGTVFQLDSNLRTRFNIPGGKSFSNICPSSFWRSFSFDYLLFCFHLGFWFAGFWLQFLFTLSMWNPTPFCQDQVKDFWLRLTPKTPMPYQTPLYTRRHDDETTLHDEFLVIGSRNCPC